jgi:succinate dehydrogenase hydrophobic anchor subunit
MKDSGIDTSGNLQSRCEACGQPIPKSDEWKERRFRWGMLLAVLTFLPYGVALESAFHTISISAQKTTGVGAVAGGFSELYVTFGLAAMVMCALAGIALLIRGYSRKNPLRVLGAIVGILWCGFAVVSSVASVVLLIFLQRQSHIR